MGRGTRTNCRPVLAYNPATGELREYVSVYKAAKDLGVAYPGVLSALDRVGGFAGGWMVLDAPENIRKRIAELKKQLSFVEDLISLKEALYGQESGSIVKSQREKEHDIWRKIQEFYSRLGNKEELLLDTTSDAVERERVIETPQVTESEELSKDAIKDEIDDEKTNHGFVFHELGNTCNSCGEQLIRGTRIDDTGLSVRAKNCLKNAGIETVSQLHALRDLELISIKNLGRKTQKELLSFLEHYELKPEEPLEDLDEDNPQEVDEVCEYYDFIFTMHSINLRATMRFVPEEKRYILLKGSGICRQSSNSLDTRSVTIRNRLLLSTSLTKNVSPEMLVLLEDYELPYHSCDVAVRVCSGTARLGRHAWITEDGRTFGSFVWRKKK